MIKTDIKVPIGYTVDDVKEAVAAHIPVTKDELNDIRILRRAIDVKIKSDIHYKMTVGINLGEERENGLLKMKKKVFAVEELTFLTPKSKLGSRPVVVGSGPCGLFAALTLAEAGAKPIIIERGLPIEERNKKVDAFFRFSVLDTECNVQFGEGGAGTYSDGKLKAGAPDKYKMKVLREFVLAGANEEILYSTTAHLGTDKLPSIIKKLREKIISLGGEFVFSAKMTGVGVACGRVKSVTYEKNGTVFEIPCENLILAIGHSAKDSFEMLYKLNIPMEAKGFGIGVRIEHPREYINGLIYGKEAPSGIETASYRLVRHLKNGRSVYSFCMCPGGTVVAAATENGGIVTNGMSEFARNAENSNAAFLVSVFPEDFASDSPLSGFDLQRRIESLAYRTTESFRAPVITMSDFLEGNPPSEPRAVKPTYPIGAVPARPEEYLPEFVTDSLRQSVSDFDAWLPGFRYGDAVLTGPETRTTSPVRILRNESYESISVLGLYPAGEGAGYAGGIVSSATDGIKCAEALLLK